MKKKAVGQEFVALTKLDSIKNRIAYEVNKQIFKKLGKTARQMKKQEEAIKKQMKDWGYYLPNGDIIISFWELAAHINNCWQTPLFLDKKKKELEIKTYDKEWAIESFEYSYFRKPFALAISNIKDVYIIMQGDKKCGGINRTFYLWRKGNEKRRKG